MQKTLCLLGSGCLALSASADLLTRVIEWDWLDGNDTAEPTTTQCYVELDSDLDVEVENGTLSVEDLYQYSETAINPDTEQFSIAYESGGRTYRDPITIRRDGYDVHVEYAALTSYVQYDGVYIESEHPAGAEAWWSEAAFLSLWLQWRDHACKDEDGDRYCDRIEMANGETFVAVPMRRSEQRALTDCLARHWNTKTSARRAGLQIAGDANLVREAQWSGQCQERPELSRSDLEEPADHPPQEIICPIFRYVEFGGTRELADFGANGALHYLCNPSTPIEGSEYTGNHIIRQAEKARGKFSGFACPAQSPQASGHAEFSTDMLKGHKVSREAWQGLQLDGRRMTPPN